MERYARIAGYSVVLAILAGMLGMVAMLREGLLFPHNRVQVRFPAIGTLMEDDPVKLRGVQIGRVASIDPARDGAIATLEFFHRAPMTKGSRFINYNYSLFGARMIILIPGRDSGAIDSREVQAGEFSTGVAETIHKVEDLLITVMEYKRLTTRLERGTDTTRSIQEILTDQVYPVLEEFGALTRDMERWQNAAGSELDRISAATAGFNHFGRDLATQSDTLVVRANRTLARLATLTAQTTLVLRGLEEIVLACQDTAKGPSRFLVQREIYDRTLALTHALRDILKVVREDGLTDAIHFWRNVHIHWKKPPAD